MKSKCNRAVAALLVAAAGQAAAQDVQWIDAGGGLWSSGSNWDSGVPGIGANAIFQTAGTYTVDVDVSPSLFELRVSNPMVTLDVDPNRTVTVTGPTMTNNGIVFLNRFGSSLNSVLGFTGNVVIEGAGEIWLRTRGDNAQLNGPMVTNGADHSIRGVGQLNAAVDNRGLIAADIAVSVSGGDLLMSGSPSLNSGDILARASSTLDLFGTDLMQTPTGQLLADQGTLRVLDGSRVSGGLFGSVNGGTFQFLGSTQLSGATSTGLWQITPGANVQVDAAGVINNGIASMNQTGSSVNALLTATQSMTIDGSGELWMRTFGDNSQLDTSMNAVITHASGHQIRGVGQLDAELVNNGQIWADVSVSVSGNRMDVREADKVNNNVMGARPGSIMRISSLMIDQSAGGQLIADGGTIEAISSIIRDGSISTPGGGMFTVTSGTVQLQNGVDLNGSWQLNPGTGFAVDSAGLINNGVGVLNPAGSASNSTIVFADGVLAGTGTIFMRTFGDNSQINTEPGATLTQASGHTIRGVGDINAELVNFGQIVADVGSSVSGNILAFRSNPKHNNADISIQPSTNLNLISTDLTQAPSATITNNDGSFRLQGTTRVEGGTYNANGSGRLFVEGPTTLNDLILNGDMTINAGRTVTVDALGITNNAVINMNPAGSASDSVLHFLATSELGGNGSVVMQTAGADSRITAEPGAVLTLGVNQDISGVGQISAPLINNGKINANVGLSVSGSSFILTGGDKTNNTLIDVFSGTLLDVFQITIDQTGGGELRAQGTGEIRLRSSRIRGGAITSMGEGGPGFYTVPANGTVLEDMTVDLNGTVSPGVTLVVEGSGLTNNGVLTLNSAGSASDSVLSFDSSASLDGTGTILMRTTADNAQIASNPGAVVTMEAGHTVRGVGRIAAEFVNNGEIIADVASSVSGNVFELREADKTNNSTITVEPNTLLRIAGARVNQSPTASVRVATSAVVDFDPGSILSGGRLTGQSASDLGTYTVTATDALFENLRVDLDGSLAGGQRLNYTGPTFEHNGMLVVNTNGSAADAIVRFTESTVLTGSGEIRLQGLAGDAQLQSLNEITLRNTGGHTISGRGQVGPDFFNESILEPGNNAVGTMQFVGDFEQTASGEFNVEIGSGAFDRIDVGDQARLGGTLNVGPAAGFSYIPGASAVIVQASEIVGEFDDFVIDRQGDIVTRLVYGPTTVRLATACIADANLDGVVNGTDFGAWLNAFNENDLIADCNLDGVVNGLDFGAWLNAFNTPCP